ncbi:hypothetical protein [Nocardia sp. NBC_01327]|uniref:hypothetical protein n=1 Tax=Nocardia sp. NBC_01327 TaxID=2903593 RepID=UPI002E12C4DD|nr:hypothetical protein OG326_42330 [Nocardia sp. NBC_01327]
MTERPAADPTLDHIGEIPEEDRGRIYQMLVTSQHQQNPPQWTPDGKVIADVWIIEQRLRADRLASDKLTAATRLLTWATVSLGLTTLGLVIATFALVIATLHH